MRWSRSGPASQSVWRRDGCVCSAGRAAPTWTSLLNLTPFVSTGSWRNCYASWRIKGPPRRPRRRRDPRSSGTWTTLWLRSKASLLNTWRWVSLPTHKHVHELGCLKSSHLGAKVPLQFAVWNLKCKFYSACLSGPPWSLQVGGNTCAERRWRRCWTKVMTC